MIYAASAAELARWDAADPAKATGLRLEPAENSAWHFASLNGIPVMRLEPSTDYYTRSACLLDLDEAPARKTWLVLDYLDRGYGLIALTPGRPQTKQWGIARVNSGRLRRAVFEYDTASVLKQLRLEGLDCLRAAVLLDEPPQPEPAPPVEPALKFSRASERVTSAVGDGTGPDQVAEALASVRNLAPLIKALGFNGVEVYVRWGYVERQRANYDWSYYDAIVEALEQQDLGWFPMLLAGSGYALPKWLHDSKDNVGFQCLEHGLTNDTQSIFYPFQAQYARRFISEFGKHYGQRKSLLGVRLGPSGDYGEAQYPAKGPGYGFREGHTHIGYWAGDPYAQSDFGRYLKERYSGIAQLNTAWNSHYRSFSQLKPFLVETALTRRQRIDFANWYVGAMSDWCARWAIWAREALPNTPIYQSSGGWGPIQIGTDYSFQARSMAGVHGGLRLTNEGDDFPDNFTITRMASSAARFYGIGLGYEPGGFGSKRGVMGRLFNAVTTDANHLFYYLGNLTGNDQAINAWINYGALLDERAQPIIDVVAFYPDTAIKLDDELVRYRWASTYFTVGRTLREVVDFDYASEQMVIDGALDRYKVLLFLWGAVTEKPVLERIDQWVRQGGILVYAPRPRGDPATVEGDSSLAKRWRSGDTGQGKVILWQGDLIPSQSYAEFVRAMLLQTASLRPQTLSALQMDKPPTVFWSALTNGKLALLNFGGQSALVHFPGGKTVTIPPYEMLLQ